jgi:hypothetical protein
MSSSIQKCVMPALFAVMLAGFAPPALAQLSTVTPAHDIYRGGTIVVKYYVAYDSVNQVYMAVFDGTPARAVFLDKHGTVILGPIDITDPSEMDNCAPTCSGGFTRVVFGGPSGKPRFLVAYTILEPGATANNPRRVRLIDYNGGSPVIGAPITIANLRGNWNNSDLGQPVWTGQQFIIPWCPPTAAAEIYPNTFVVGMDADGNFTNGGQGQALGDGQTDAMANPGVACDSTSNVCLATGFAWGVPFGPPWGGTWARRFDATTLAPIGGDFYLDSHHALMEDQRVAFNKKTGQFQAAWVHSESYIDFRVIGTDGTLGPLDLSKSIGPSLGQIQLSYNAGTQTTLLTLKDNKDAWAVELNDQGYVPSIYNSVLITIQALAADGGDYYSSTLYPAPAANDADGQWLVGYASMSVAGRAAVIAATPPVLGVTAVSPASGPITGGTVVTITGHLFQEGAIVSFGSAAATSVAVLSSTQIQATVPATATPGVVAVTVTNPDATTATLTSAYTYFIPVTLTVSVVGNGTVTASGINCPGTCSATLPIGTAATLVPTPAAGYVFAGWSGDADCQDGVLSMNASTSCSARFIADCAIDFNSDGKADIVWRNRTTGQIVIWYLNGTAYSGYTVVSSPSLDSTWRIGAIADFNVDEQADFVWRNSTTGENQIWFNNGNGTFTTAPLPPEPDFNWKIVGAGDFNGDGKPDLMWRNATTGENRVWCMNGATFIASINLNPWSDANWRIVAVADFNGDRNPDLLWRSVSTGENQIWYMNGTSYLEPAVINSAADVHWSVAGAWDFNGDGKPDILWRNSATGDDVVWLMNGAAYLGYERVPSVADPTWDIVRPPESAGWGPADLNRDGSSDVVWRNVATGENRVWYMDGNGLVASAAIPTVTDLNWRIIGTADFDGDGKPDILWRNISTGQNVIWYMNGHTYVRYADAPAVPDPNWQAVGIADFNGDGKPDMLWRNATTGVNILWYVNGSAYAGYRQLPTVADVNWTIVGAADFNGDGKPDIVWQNQSTGQSVIWFMSGPDYAAYAFLPTIADTNWQIVAIADYNGDGKPDLLWRNKITGVNLIWLMDGPYYSGWRGITTEPDTNWKIGPGLR